jgi:hypothetical protein
MSYNHKTEIEMKNETKDYMEGLVLIKEKQQLISDINSIIGDFRDEGFYDGDIYEYLNGLILNELHNKYSDTLNQLRKG